MRPFKMAVFLKKPVMIYGIGANGTASERDARVLRRFFPKAIRITVRDEESRKVLLKELGKGFDVQIIRDPAFDYLIHLKAPNRKELSSLTVHISLRDLFFKEMDAERARKMWDQFCQKYSQFVVHVVSRWGATCRFISYSTPQDDRAICELLDYLPNWIAKEVKLLRLENCLADFVYRVADCDVLIGMRLHSIITGLSFGRPVINISYAEKTSNIFNILDLEDWVVGAQELATRDGALEYLKQLFDSIVTNKIQAAARISLAMQRFRSKYSSGSVKDLLLTSGE
jgi:polysaccharide pyruvyl transferase WcaK-like protein